MTREEAKKMAQSRDCHCVKGKDRDSNYNECVDKIFDYHENELRKWRILLTSINCLTCNHQDISIEIQPCYSCGNYSNYQLKPFK